MSDSIIESTVDNILILTPDSLRRIADDWPDDLPKLKDAIEKLLDDQPEKSVLLDVQMDVVFIQFSAAFNGFVIVPLWKRLQERFAICNVSRDAMEVFAINRFAEMISIFATRDEAVEALSQQDEPT